MRKVGCGPLPVEALSARMDMDVFGHGRIDAVSGEYGMIALRIMTQDWDHRRSCFVSLTQS